MTSLKTCLLFCSVILGVFIGNTQKNYRKPLYSQFDLGSDISVGENVTKETIGQLNTNYALSYYSPERFQYPSIRTRGAILYAFTNRFSVGIQTGVSVRFYKPYNQKIEKSFAVPVQLRGLFSIFHKKKVDLSIDVNGGLNIQNQTLYEAYRISTGSLVSCGINIVKNRWSLRAGYEFQKDQATFHIIPSPRYSFVEEKIPYSIRRNLLFFSFGRIISFN